MQGLWLEAGEVAIVRGRGGLSGRSARVSLLARRRREGEREKREKTRGGLSERERARARPLLALATPARQCSGHAHRVIGDRAPACAVRAGPQPGGSGAAARAAGSKTRREESVCRRKTRLHCVGHAVPLGHRERNARGRRQGRQRPRRKERLGLLERRHGVLCWGFVCLGLLCCVCGVRCAPAVMRRRRGLLCRSSTGDDRRPASPPRRGDDQNKECSQPPVPRCLSREAHSTPILTIDRGRFNLTSN